jgi:hypothetical protein
MYPTKISHKDSEMYQNKIEKMIIKKSYWALNIYIKEQLLVMFRVKKMSFSFDDRKILWQNIYNKRKDSLH